MTRESWGTKLEERVAALEARALPEDWHGEATFVAHEIRLDRLEEPADAVALDATVCAIIDREARLASEYLKREHEKRLARRRELWGVGLSIAVLCTCVFVAGYLVGVNA